MGRYVCPLTRTVMALSVESIMLEIDDLSAVSFEREEIFGEVITRIIEVIKNLYTKLKSLFQRFFSVVRIAEKQLKEIRETVTGTTNIKEVTLPAALGFDNLKIHAGIQKFNTMLTDTLGPSTRKMANDIIAEMQKLNRATDDAVHAYGGRHGADFNTFNALMSGHTESIIYLGGLRLSKAENLFGYSVDVVTGTRRTENMSKSDVLTFIDGCIDTCNAIRKLEQNAPYREKVAQAIYRINSRNSPDRFIQAYNQRLNMWKDVLRIEAQFVANGMRIIQGGISVGKSAVENIN